MRVDPRSRLVCFRGWEFFMKKLVGYLKDESGQTSTEYILLIAVVAMIIFKLKGKMSDGLGRITDTVFTKAEDLASKIE